jgi:hypothetical protein
MVMGSGSPIDQDAIITGANVFQDRLGGCVYEVQFTNTRDGPFQADPKSPREVRITVTPAIHQKGGYFDIQWWQNGDYKYHYQEPGLEFRYGREEDNAVTSDPVRHYHPPSDPSEHRNSCIGPNHPPERVTLAVIACWFPAAKNGDPELLNSQRNPP